MAKPIIKWVGGKRRLISEIKAIMPENFNNYFEPFIGGGALFFDLDLEGKQAVINDYNSELTNLYKIVKNTPKKLHTSLKKHKLEKDYYYDVRALDRVPNYVESDATERASRFIYLNKAGFNGMYRVNKSGYFNVPMGRYNKLAMPSYENLKDCSDKLKNTKIMTGDFDRIRSKVKAGDLVYLDPPYAETFVGYTDKGFDDDMQVRVRDLCKYIDSIGAYFIASNSTAPIIYELYKNFNIKEVDIGRNMGGKGAKRKKVQETLITNLK